MQQRVQFRFIDIVVLGKIKFCIEIFAWVPALFPPVFNKMHQWIHIRSSHIRVGDEIVGFIKQTTAFDEKIMIDFFTHACFP